jgi:hypothetical protein
VTATTDYQIRKLTMAVNAAEVAEILAWENTELGIPLNDADGYFAAEDGTAVAWRALKDAGWVTPWSGGKDHYVMRAPDGSTITYNEGSVYLGDRRPQ